MYKYDWYWKKSRPGGFVNAKLKPLKDIETVSVFSTGATANGAKENRPYYPQGLEDAQQNWKRPDRYFTDAGTNPARKSHKLERVIEKKGYPRQVLEYANPNHGNVHPTQKPVALCEYLIKTYTDENETVLDNCMGSGTTGIACLNTNRNFIGIEKDETYFNLVKDRIATWLI
jgi:site-specific DNA-methyltransferase (adenine-specific)